MRVCFLVPSGDARFTAEVPLFRLRGRDRRSHPGRSRGNGRDLAARRGDLPAAKAGRDWLVASRDLAAFERHHRGRLAEVVSGPLGVLRIRRCVVAWRSRPQRGTRPQQ